MIRSVIKTKYPLAYILTGLWLCTMTQPVLAEKLDKIVLWEPAQKSYAIESIEFSINPIFDPEQSHGWLYQVANKLHLNTKPYVIERLLPFKVGDTIKRDDILEAERILRSHKYLREAKIVTRPGANNEKIRLQVQTWENWTLFPTVSFSSEGGESKYSYGIKDDNLLGLGIGTNMAFFSERDRSGYILSFLSNTLTDQHFRTALSLANNSDGEQYVLSVDKPFYVLDDRYAAGIKFNSQQREISIDSNEILVNRFESERQFTEAYYGYSSGKTPDGIFRYYFGITHDKNEFNLNPLTSILPQSRDLTYPWIEFSYQRNRFVTTRNLYLLSKTEDVQLGWRYTFKLGYNLETSYAKKGWIWQLSSDYFDHYNDKHWYRYGLKGDGVYTADKPPTAYFSAFYEYFYRASNAHTWYLKATYQGADNPYLDQPLVLGGETGLRGYPSEYQHGKKRWLLNLEKRFYPDINLWRLIDVGFVAFADVGRNFGESPYQNQEIQALASVGLGLRLFLSRSSGRNVININFAQPVNSDFVKDFDVSVIVKSSF